MLVGTSGDLGLTHNLLFKEIQPNKKPTPPHGLKLLNPVSNGSGLQVGLQLSAHLHVVINHL